MRQLLSYAVFLLVFGIVSYATADLTGDLAVYFTFDNIEGKRILDESGNELDAEINENTKFVKGKYGDAIQIKAATENCVNIPVSDVLKISDEISMMAWVYQEKWRGSSVQWFDKGVFTPMQHQSYGMAVYDKNDMAAANFVEGGSAITITLGGISDGAEARRQLLAPNRMEDRTWYHIVGTHNGENTFIYLDGKVLNEAGGGDQKLNFLGINDEELRIGCVKSKPHYAFEDGAIDEVAIWSRALGEDEIKTAMRGQLFPVSLKDKIATMWGDIKREAF
ncbi:LamG domain-containing protein [Candidatus Poribacteria bacterium]|nr:LamG domain-containing protein [Candidatus Poribacteria bacterium]